MMPYSATRPQWVKNCADLGRQQLVKFYIVSTVAADGWAPVLQQVLSWPCFGPVIRDWHISGLVQDCGISIANALEILQSYTNPSILSQVIVADNCLRFLHLFLNLKKKMFNLMIFPSDAEIMLFPWSLPLSYLVSLATFSSNAGHTELTKKLCTCLIICCVLVPVDIPQNLPGADSIW